MKGYSKADQRQSQNERCLLTTDAHTFGSQYVSSITPVVSPQMAHTRLRSKLKRVKAQPQ